MSTAMRPKPTFPIQTSVSTYDRVSGMVTALVIMLGSVVVVEFLMWLSLREPEQRLTVEAELLGPELGEDDRPEGEAQDIEEPGSEFPEVETPQIADSLEALSTALSSVPASDRDVDGSATEMGAGRGLGTRGGGGSGNGKGKSPWERWEIRYTTASKEAYAQQLDSLGIVLGAISRDTPDIVYLENLSTAPRTRSGRKSQEKRVFFNYNQGVLKDWDQQFMAQAGINLRNRILVQFYPPGLQARLLELERGRLSGRELASVYRTVFGVRPGGGGFEFYVIDQTYQ